MTVPVPVWPQGSLEDGRIIDTSLSRDPLQVELGKRQVIPGERWFWGTGGGGIKMESGVPLTPPCLLLAGLEQSLLDMCVG